MYAENAATSGRHKDGSNMTLLITAYHKGKPIASKRVHRSMIGVVRAEYREQGFETRVHK